MEPISSTASRRSCSESQASSDSRPPGSIRISSVSPRSPRARWSAAAGQIATAPAIASELAAASIAMKPPMLEPLTHTRSASTPSRPARKRGHRERRRRARRGSCRPRSRRDRAGRTRRAAQPLAAQARPKSPWFSLRDPAPWTITIPGQGGGDCGSQSRYGRPACTPARLGGRPSCSSPCATYLAARGGRPPPVRMDAHGRHHREIHGRGLARLSGREPRERSRPSGGGRMRRGRARGRVRHADVYLRRGRHARPRPRLSRRLPGAHAPTSRSCTRARPRRSRRSTGCSPSRGFRSTSPRAASSTWRFGPGSIPARSTCTGTTRPRPSFATRSRRASVT